MRTERASWRKTGLMTGMMCLGLTLAPLGAGCGGATRFQVSETAETTVEGGNIASSILGVAFPDLTTFDLASSQEFENQGISKDQINSVTLDSFKLKVVSPTGQDLSFFKSIHFFVESEGLDRVEIAYADEADLTPGTTEVNLHLDDQEMVDYVTAETMSVTTEVRAQQPSQDTTLEADIVFNINATVQGVWDSIKENI